MSRLTGSPFHKPSPFEFPRAPLSPPDTNVEIIGPVQMHSAHSHIQQHSANSVLGGFDPRTADAEPSPAHGTLTPDSAGARFRKMSSIAYHSSGLRESRERTPQRGSKAFVVVIPPASFTQEHGQLGNTLSSGPRHRLSQGMLMPLFPTNGMTMTPRISDDAWPFIWSHVFEASPAPRSSPISGKIEFDIDMRQARWYASWMASSHREYVDNPFSVAPSVVPSVVHHDRGDSKTTFHDTEDQEESRYAAPTTRHVPRKLSLVDRYDIMSIRSGREGSRPASRSALSPPEPAQASAQVLSPIFQEDEPKSAKHDLDSRVKSWRASAVLKPTPLAATGQTSLEPANLPNTIPIEDTILESPNDELNLADFAWSVSSAGPNDYDPMSPMSWDRVPSVHIANRMEGSVCLTSSDCTSFGPSDYTLPSPGPSIYRLPSPDIAQRMYEDCPPTPSTATSWGAPLEWPASPFVWSRTPSVDLGDRGVFSRPVTPSTATSWGPASWPSSPAHSEYSISRSVHLGDRGEYSRPVTPSTATSWGAPLSYPPSPTTPFYVNTPDAGHRGFEDSEGVSTQRSAPWGHSWPYNSESLHTSESSRAVGVHSRHASVPEYSERRTAPWALSWPYRSAAPGSSEVPDSDPPLVQSAPWGHSWPYHLEASHTAESSERHTAPWALSWPYRGAARRSSEVLVSIAIYSPSAYPRLVIYQPVYPHFDLYPAVALAKADAPGYPSFNIYLPLSLTIPAPQQMSSPLSPVIVKVESCYPAFDLYPAVYPGNIYEIYPSVTVPSVGSVTVEDPVPPVSVKVAARYPFFDLYPAVYPHVSPYPQAHGLPVLDNSPRQRLPGYPDFELYPAIAAVTTNDEEKIVGRPFAGYPDFNLYPAIDPSTNLRQKTFSALTPVSVTVKARYPFFNLYPAVYPNFDLYPALERHDAREAASRPTAGYPSALTPVSVTVKARYPYFSLCKS
ncbi:hypothetical protein DXG03_000382 [Asterophora parasitica]|uniref:Uncharacterized protein n=1 Tax=Asterophora parasitica TaxID=117018 RepID=A0A9P7KFY8_9AGAR|nr:hypothetical protein DXG03_000382 [Asterophora parasitica]